MWELLGKKHKFGLFLSLTQLIGGGQATRDPVSKTIHLPFKFADLLTYLLTYSMVQSPS